MTVQKWLQPQSKEGGRSVHCWKLSSCISQGHDDPGLVAAHIGGVNSWISSASIYSRLFFTLEVWACSTGRFCAAAEGSGSCWTH